MMQAGMLGRCLEAVEAGILFGDEPSMNHHSKDRRATAAKARGEPWMLAVLGGSGEHRSLSAALEGVLLISRQLQGLKSPHGIDLKQYLQELSTVLRSNYSTYVHIS